MPGVFAITTATNTIHLSDNRQGEASFSVFNASGRAIRGQARLVGEDPAVEGWLTLAGQAERSFDIASAEQYTVRIRVPPDAAAGSYPFRLDMVGVEDTDRDYAKGPGVTFAVPEPQPKPKPFPWWILAIVAIVLVGGGVVAYILWPRTPNTFTMRDFQGSKPDDAETILVNSICETPPCSIVQRESEHSKQVRLGGVVRTDPPAGEAVDVGSMVTLIVSLGYPPVPFPPVIGDPVENALTKLQNACDRVPCFTQIGLRYRFVGFGPEQQVIDSVPEAGTQISPDEAVTLVVLARDIIDPDTLKNDLFQELNPNIQLFIETPVP